MALPINPVSVWKDFHDHLIPVLRLRPSERALYSHLLRHTRLLGRRSAAFTIRELAQGVCLSDVVARQHLFGLIRKGCVRRAVGCHNCATIFVRLPTEILRATPRIPRSSRARQVQFMSRPKSNPAVARQLLQRTGGRCFYCSARLHRRNLEFDHVVPLSRGGVRSLENLVPACRPCNRAKCARSAHAYLNELLAARRISSKKFRARCASVKAIIAALHL